MVYAAFANAKDDAHREALTEALEPPNAIDPTTGLPYGWDPDDEDAQLDGLPMAG